MKKAVLIIAIATLLAGFSIQDANAAGGWYSCNVVSLGQLGDLTAIQLTDVGGTFTSQWYVPLTTKSKEMLATAMFAVANSRKVTVYLTDTAQYGIIVVFLLQASS